MQGITMDNIELKNLILENPDLPLVVFATEEANSGEWSTELASCNCYKGSVLDATKDCWLPRDDRVYTDVEDLEDDVRDVLDSMEEYKHFSDAELEDVVVEKLEALEPYWKECIIITVDRF